MRCDRLFCCLEVIVCVSVLTEVTLIDFNFAFSHCCAFSTAVLRKRIF